MRSSIFLNIFIIAFVVFFIPNIVRSVTLTWQEPTNCQPTQFFNPVALSCESCMNGTISTENRNGCQCAHGQRLTNWTGGTLTCEQCTENWATSDDGFECVQCVNSNNSTIPRDLTTGYCPACNVNEIIVRNGTTQRCVPCGQGETAGDQKLLCIPCNNVDCFCYANPTVCSGNGFSSIIQLENSQNFLSSYIQSNLPFARAQCANGYRVQCQHLANMCVLQNYNEDDLGSACAYLKTLRLTNNAIVPSILYDNNGYVELTSPIADTIFTVEENSTNSYLDIFAASYALNGTFLGLVPINTGILNVCPTLETTIKGSFLFGRQVEQTCVLTIDEVLTSVLKNRETRGTIFYELYLRFSSSNGRQASPILILNQAIKDRNNRYVNRDLNQPSQWRLTTRFFLADIQRENNNFLLRVPSYISLQIQMSPSRNGQIYPPYLILRNVEFLTSSNSSSILETTFSSKFSIQYSISSERHDKTIEILMAVFCSVSTLWGALYAYSWFRRAGKPMLDLSTLIKLILYECEVISNIFLLVMGCTAVWITFAYKLQKHMVYVLLSYEQEWSFVAYMISALGLKTISLFHTYISLALTQTFFVDWERPTTIMEAPTIESQSSELRKIRKPIVIWRTYLIANEWNELQNYRKTSIAFQLLLVLFVLEFLDFRNYAIIQPGFARGDQPPEYASSRMSRFAVDLVAYMIFGIGQWIAQVLIIEKIVDRFRNFMDLCSVANISVVALTHPLRGYYIHGRSVHGQGDTDMTEMNTFLQREKDNLCSLRGLENGSELQTFIMNLPRTFRDKYDEITSPLRSPTQSVDVRLTGTDRNTAKIENTSKVYSDINQFLKNVIDHANPEIDYTITESKLVEDVLGLEMRDTSKVGTFTRDPSEIAYSNAFLYGNEWVNMSFEMLLFCVLDMATHNRIFAAAITYLASTLIRKVAKIFFTNNLIKSSLVDGRFLI